MMTEMTEDLNTTANLTAALAFEQEKSIEAALRPKKLSQFVGQPSVRSQLELLINSAKIRKTSPDHILFAGPPGLGKTTLAMITANEMSSNLRITSGPSITRSGDLAAILSNIEEGDTLFIDEIHRLAKTAQEMLYIAMEDFRVDIVVGKGVGASAIALPLPRFTLIGATTRSGLLPSPLRDRFGFIAQMDYYSSSELSEIVISSAKKIETKIDKNAAEEIAKRARGTARIANRLLSRVRDFAVVHNPKATSISLETAKTALDLFEVDENGLDRLDRAVLDAIVNRFSGGPVGISALAQSVGEEVETIETVTEPFLVRLGLIARSPRGRTATQKALNMFDAILG